MPHSLPTRRLPRQPSLEQLRKQAKELLASIAPAIPRRSRRCDGSSAHPTRRHFRSATRSACWRAPMAMRVGPSSRRSSMEPTSPVSGGSESRRHRPGAGAARRPSRTGGHGHGREQRTSRAAFRSAAPRCRDGPPVDGSRRRREEGHFPASRCDYRFRAGAGSRLSRHRRGYRGRRAEAPEVDELSQFNGVAGAGTDQRGDSKRRRCGARFGCLKRIESLIHACDRDGGTPLHVAAQETNRGNGRMAAAPGRKREENGCEAADPARPRRARRRSAQ